MPIDTFRSALHSIDVSQPLENRLAVLTPSPPIITFATPVNPPNLWTHLRAALFQVPGLCYLSTSFASAHDEVTSYREQIESSLHVFEQFMNALATFGDDTRDLCKTHHGLETPKPLTARTVSQVLETLEAAITMKNTNTLTAFLKSADLDALPDAGKKFACNHVAEACLNRPDFAQCTLKTEVMETALTQAKRLYALNQKELPADQARRDEILLKLSATTPGKDPAALIDQVDKAVVKAAGADWLADSEAKQNTETQQRKATRQAKQNWKQAKADTKQMQHEARALAKRAKEQKHAFAKAVKVLCDPQTGHAFRATLDQELFAVKPENAVSAEVRQRLIESAADISKKQIRAMTNIALTASPPLNIEFVLKTTIARLLEEHKLAPASPPLPNRLQTAEELKLHELALKLPMNKAGTNQAPQPATQIPSNTEQLRAARATDGTTKPSKPSNTPFKIVKNSATRFSRHARNPHKTRL